MHFIRGEVNEMSQMLTHDALVSALREGGLCAGDTVHVQSDLRRLGLPDCTPSRSAMLQFYLSAFQEVIGPEGTLTVHTPSESYARYNKPFVLEETPSTAGSFSEYVRKLPGSVRSLHPIVSVTGIGPQAQYICGECHNEGFGWDSPWGRLHRANAKILAFGLDIEHDGGTSFLHYVENLYGMPYLYTKIYTTPVYAGGNEISGPFTMAVRYLDFGVVVTGERVRRRLVDKGIMRRVPVGDGHLLCGPSAAIVDEGVRCFRKDRFFMLQYPPKFRAGVIPMDGATGTMRIYVDKAAEA